MKLESIPAHESYLYDVMQWLNHDLPKAHQYKTMAMFMNEFVPAHFGDPALPPMMAVTEGQAIGFVHFTRYANVLPPGMGRACGIHVVISPEERGKGHSHQLFALATEYIHGLGWDCVIAEISPDNTQLIRLFSRLGYYNLEDSDGEAQLRFAHCL